MGGSGLQAYRRKFFLLVLDIETINLALILALVFRFEGVPPVHYMNLFTSSFAILTLIKISIYFFFGLYNSLWKYASVDELIQIFTAVSVGSAIEYIYRYATGCLLPMSVYIITWLLTLLFLGGTRLFYRISRRTKNMMIKRWDKVDAVRVMVIGAGEAGSMVIKEMKANQSLRYMPVVVIDDDPAKRGASIHGVPVKGGQDKIVEAVEQYEVDEIIIAIPSASRQDIHDLLNICKETKSRLRTLPGMCDLIDNKVSIKDIRDVRIEDLLGRQEIKLENAEISDYLEGEVVLVTGGGGSIGSELCRQIAKFHPKKLLVLDIYENNAYDLQNEFKYTYGNSLNLEVIIASVRDKERLRSIFSEYRPGVVFHAAAHKHVPLMEDNPVEAIKNNVFGTLNTATCADEYGVKKFVLISTDKAVNPTNIMGATKRLAEMIVQSLNKQSKTEFVAVRFGNVLGSNGSVIPLFKRQIEQGGPVTVTHPEINRFFMTIPEAAQLVIQAGAMANGGEIFILDMGEPVRIDDLARDLIRLSGFEPDIDIEIKYTGLRPGEKLYEELLMDEEGIQRTGHDKIFIGKPLDLSFNEVMLCIKALEGSQNSPEMIRECMKNIVDTYQYDYSTKELAIAK